MRFFWVFFLLPCAIFAQEVAPWKVIDTITGNWNPDTHMDRAALVQTNDSNLGPMLDLVIYANDGETLDFTEVARIRDVAWQGVAWGTHVSIIENEAGDVQVSSGNGIADDTRWSEEVSIYYVDGAYRVTGFFNDWFDANDLEKGGGCYLDFLSGMGDITDGMGDMTPFEHSIPAQELSYWNRAEAAEECRKHLPPI